MSDHLTPEILKEAEWLFKQSWTFLRGIQSLKDLPDENLPEIAFAGRSNVGKSSLINALLNRKGVARTSNTPGRTQELNFFNIHNTFYLVDMPGYGFAKAPKEVVKKWNTLIKNYLLKRSNLKRVYVLVDSRHGLKPNDMEFLDMLDECAISYQIVLTKTDKIGKLALQEVFKNTFERIQKHPAAYPFLGSTSSQKKDGLTGIRGEIKLLIS
ncbi:MAG: YihA family ribosome biogenesis GTP-binding protein [Proteobacteria bacterium]|nr:YihA family ribosome biogenesis GTP-binding protein [Pseudomonadota bacterium]